MYDLSLTEVDPGGDPIPAAKNHLSYLPHSGTVLSSLQPGDLEGHSASKGALKFAIDTPLEGDLVAKLIATRLAEIAA